MSNPSYYQNIDNPTVDIARFQSNASSSSSSSDENLSHDLPASRKVDTKSKLIGVNEFVKETGNIKIPTELLSFDSNQVSLWLTHYPIQRNHPRRPSLDETADVPYIQSDEAICMQSRDKLFDCLNCLIRHGISTVPVLDENNQVMAVVDLLDIIFFILRSFGVFRENESLNDPNALQIYWEQFLKTWNLGAGIRNVTIAEAIKKPIWAYKHKFVTIKPFYSTFSVLEMLVREHLHAIPIVDSNGTPRNIFTRSMMISLIDQNIDLFGDLMVKQVSVLVSLLSLPTVISVTENSSVLEAFKTMVQLNCSGLPVVDNENHLVNCISRRDVRGLITGEMDFKRLWMNVGELKRLVEQEFPQQTPQNVLYVTKHDTLKKLINLMNDGNIHRVFVVEEDENKKLNLKSVITQYDLLKFLLIQLGLQF